MNIPLSGRTLDALDASVRRLGRALYLPTLSPAVRYAVHDRLLETMDEADEVRWLAELAHRAASAAPCPPPALPNFPAWDEDLDDIVF